MENFFFHSEAKFTNDEQINSAKLNGPSLVSDGRPEAMFVFEFGAS